MTSECVGNFSVGQQLRRHCLRLCVRASRSPLTRRRWRLRLLLAFCGRLRESTPCLSSWNVQLGRASSQCRYYGGHTALFPHVISMRVINYFHALHEEFAERGSPVLLRIL